MFRIRKEIGRGIILRVATPNQLKKHYFHKILSGASHDRNSSSFIKSFKQWVIGFSIEVYNSFLSYLTQKLWAIKVGSVKKRFHLLNKMDFFDSSNFDGL